MELIVVSPPDYFEGEGSLFNQLFAEGLPLLHIRKPANDRERFRRLMMEISPEYYPAIAIHQHHELAEEFSLSRLHYTEQHRQSAGTVELTELRTLGFSVSSSVHNLESLPDLDYVLYGPVFNSISKTGYQTRLTADFVLPDHQTKIFAIGGVSEDKLAQLKEMNFDGAAVLGTIWHQQNDPLAAFRKLDKAINNL